jgi:hypothetical protein
MNRDTAINLLDRLQKAQNEFYAGGSGAALEQILAPTITWTVPGDNRIAGNYRGLEEVLGYFRRRRDLADRTFTSSAETFSSATETDSPRLPTGSRQSAASTIAGPPWACTTSSTDRSQLVGCSRLTNAHLTRSGPPEPTSEAIRAPAESSHAQPRPTLSCRDSHHVHG